MTDVGLLAVNIYKLSFFYFKLFRLYTRDGAGAFRLRGHSGQPALVTLPLGVSGDPFVAGHHL